MLFLDWWAELHNYTHAHTHYFIKLHLACFQCDVERWAEQKDTTQFNFIVSFLCYHIHMHRGWDAIQPVWGVEYHWSSSSQTNMAPKVHKGNTGFPLCFHFLSASWKPAESSKTFKSSSLLIRKLHNANSDFCASNPKQSTAGSDPQLAETLWTSLKWMEPYQFTPTKMQSTWLHFMPSPPPTQASPNTTRLKSAGSSHVCFSSLKKQV